MATAFDEEYIKKILEVVDKKDDFLRELINMGIKLPEGINPREIYGKMLVDLVDEQISKKNIVLIPSPMHRVYLQVVALRDHEYYLRQKEAWYASEQCRAQKDITMQMVIDSWNEEVADSIHGWKHSDKFNFDYLNNYFDYKRELSSNQIRFGQSLVDSVCELEKLAA